MLYLKYINIMLSLLTNLSKYCYLHNLKRKSFNLLEDRDIDYFKSFMPPRNVVTDPDQIAPHNLCWRKIDKGDSKLMLFPQTTQQVSNILKYCNQRLLAVVPQGGNTGLVGGSVPVFDEIIISLKKMDKIEGFNEVSSIVNCQAGVVLEKLNQYVETYGYEIPLDLGAKGSCYIGGNAATNAGGKYIIKYGSLRSHILGLQAVAPNGDILDLRSQIHKDNTGFDLKQLFIGGQGIIGIITKLNILCEKIDSVKKIMVFKADKFETILQSIPIIKKYLGKNLAALEYMDGITYQTVIRNLYPPIFNKVEAQEQLLFVQASTEDLDGLFELLPEFNDSIMSNNNNEYNKIWKIRQDVAVSGLLEKGKMLAYDVSFDVTKWPGLVNRLRKETKALVLSYGHIGDGNLHLNICLPEIQQFNQGNVFEQVIKNNGSISAEHGVGLHKPQFLHLQKSPQILQIYKGIKNLFDPNGIMNPHKVIPD